MGAPAASENFPNGLVGDVPAAVGVHKHFVPVVSEAPADRGADPTAPSCYECALTSCTHWEIRGLVESSRRAALNTIVARPASRVRSSADTVKSYSTVCSS